MPTDRVIRRWVSFRGIKSEESLGQMVLLLLAETGAEGATTVGARFGSLCEDSEGTKGASHAVLAVIRDNMDTTLITNLNGRMNLHVACTIVDTHLTSDTMRCSGGMKGSATRMIPDL